jgi:hypothetical protein
MNNKSAIEVLLNKRQELATKRDVEYQRATTEICSLESAIETLSGKKVWQVEQDFVYDDENPDYIKGSIEE